MISRKVPLQKEYSYSYILVCQKGCDLLLITTLVRDESISYIDHDRLFKELIQTFFREFVEVFFPEQYIHIDFTHLKFLSQEVFTDILKGEKRKVDILS